MGIRRSALSWFKSLLSNTTFSVGFGRSVSSVALLTCGVPQGSVLGPTLFSLYMLPLGLFFPFYADYTQNYLPLKHNDKKGLETLHVWPIQDLGCL